MQMHPTESLGSWSNTGLRMPRVIAAGCTHALAVFHGIRGAAMSKAMHAKPETSGSARAPPRAAVVESAEEQEVLIDRSPDRRHRGADLGALTLDHRHPCRMLATLLSACLVACAPAAEARRGRPRPKKGATGTNPPGLIALAGGRPRKPETVCIGHAHPKAVGESLEAHADACAPSCSCRCPALPCMHLASWGTGETTKRMPLILSMCRAVTKAWAFACDNPPSDAHYWTYVYEAMRNELEQYGSGVSLGEAIVFSEAHCSKGGVRVCDPLHTGLTQHPWVAASVSVNADTWAQAIEQCTCGDPSQAAFVRAQDYATLAQDITTRVRLLQEEYACSGPSIEYASHFSSITCTQDLYAVAWAKVCTVARTACGWGLCARHDMPRVSFCPLCNGFDAQVIKWHQTPAVVAVRAEALRACAAYTTWLHACLTAVHTGWQQAQPFADHLRGRAQWLLLPRNLLRQRGASEVLPASGGGRERAHPRDGRGGLQRLRRQLLHARVPPRFPWVMARGQLCAPCDTQRRRACVAIMSRRSLPPLPDPQIYVMHESSSF